jgi:hypothetical protein
MVLPEEEEAGAIDRDQFIMRESTTTFTLTTEEEAN